MKKQQLLLLSGGIVLTALLFIFGNTVPPAATESAQETGNKSTVITTASLLDSAKKQLTDNQSSHLTELENSVVRGNVKEQKIGIYNQLARYWQDTLNHPEIAAYYFTEAAKLENSEKNLNFAARLLLARLMAETDPAMQSWLGTNAKALFDQSLQINPNSDSVKVEIGACYLFGNISSTPMEGILKIKAVADKDSTNMYAQLMLGLGGIKSGQYDKAIERFATVIKNEPGNLQAIFNLAETFERKGDKASAIAWYRKAQDLINIPEAKQELEERIHSLQ
ncbi:MAG: tetratricopeptide repeat protein [Panacibacter sp.]